MVRFMYGRNGVDQLGQFTLVVYLVVWLVQLLVGWTALAVAEYLLLLLTLFRMLSRNLDRRREENARFVQAVRPVQRRWTTLRGRLRDREHRYFKCPNCGQQMRVPRGKGRITVHCRSCGATFEENS
jgi:predicted RNA-binding Zn-ribbon protein involved in translation (DUF1610 family)